MVLLLLIFIMMICKVLIVFSNNFIFIKIEYEF